MHSKVAAGRSGRQGSGWQTERSHIRMWVNREEQLGCETDHATLGSVKIKPQNLWLQKPVGLWWQEETGTQINNLKQKEEINHQLEENEDTRIQKMRRSFGMSGTILKVPTSES